MTGRSRASRRQLLARVMAVACVLTAVMSCARREKVHYGVALVDNGMRLRVASLGSCGCITFQNRSNRPVEIVSAYKSARIGTHVLRPTDAVRVRYDWAGPDADDVYDIVAYDALLRTEEGAKIGVAFSEQSVDVGGVTDSRCNDETTCEYGSLNMNRAAAAPIGQDEVAAVRRGVRPTKADEVLEVSASRGECGCMLLRNETTEEVSVTSTLRGRVIGGTRIQPRSERYVGFDWAGDLAGDVYLMTALIPGTSGRAGETPQTQTSVPLPAPGSSGSLVGGVPASGATTASAGNASGTAPAQTEQPSPESAAATAPQAARTFERVVKFAPDGLRVVGQMDSMPCKTPIPRKLRTDYFGEAIGFLEKHEDYRYLSSAVKEQLARYAAGVEDAEYPTLDPKLEDAKAANLQLVMANWRAERADGAQFRLPTGHSVSCEFGDLNMEQMWTRGNATATGATPAATPASGRSKD